jgi:predicted membrane channel-forming protein YqfA (hemolysin III family)
MTNRKLVVFIVNTTLLFAIYVLTLLFAKEVLTSIGITLIMALVGNGATYIGGNVFHAWQKSRHYHEELNK